MRPLTRSLAAGLLAVTPFLGTPVAGLLVSSGDPDAPAHVVVTFQDDRIDESSGLVAHSGRLFTVNDSGDGPYVFEVDMRTGRTAAVLTYDTEKPHDVEAIAPGPGGTLWVGDIGDNQRWRDSIRVHRIIPSPRTARVPATTFDLVYPDGAHDAETLLVHPRTGRLFVVTKSFTGYGAVYEAPQRLRAGETEVLRRVAGVPGLVSDGAFLADGDRVVLRSYGTAAFYSYPGFRPLGRTDLPQQDQGEGIAVDRGRVYLSTEGVRTDVLEVGLRKLEVAAAREAGRPSPSPRAERSSPREHVSRREYDPKPWMGLGPAGLLLTLAGSGAALLGIRAALRRSRRRR